MDDQVIYIDPFGQHTDRSKPYLAEQSVNSRLVVVYRNEPAHLAELQDKLPFGKMATLKTGNCTMENGVCRKGDDPCPGSCDLVETGFIRFCECSSL